MKVAKIGVSDATKKVPRSTKTKQKVPKSTKVPKKSKKNPKVPKVPNSTKKYQNQNNGPRVVCREKDLSTDHPLREPLVPSVILEKSSWQMYRKRQPWFWPPLQLNYMLKSAKFQSKLNYARTSCKYIVCEKCDTNSGHLGSDLRALLQCNVNFVFSFSDQSFVVFLDSQNQIFALFYSSEVWSALPLTCWLLQRVGLLQWFCDKKIRV